MAYGFPVLIKINPLWTYVYVRARTVINAQARCLVVINMDQYSSDSESSEPEAGPSDVNTVRSQIFSKKITESLENLYSGGMEPNTKWRWMLPWPAQG